MWDFEKNFTLVRSFEGHIHYVMMLIFNPRDSNIFASASIDKTIKVNFFYYNIFYIYLFYIKDMEY